MHVLRDVREATRLLILLEITTNRHSRMKSIAERVGLTVQGVSGYLKSMAEDGLVHRVGGFLTATMKGVELLHARFKELRDFVDASSREMRILDICSAMAGSEVKEGDRVGLVMEDGYLVAYTGREASSKGKALHDAAKGEDVALVELEGIVDLKLGRIALVRVPGARQGGTNNVDLDRAREFISSHPVDKVAVNDAVARILATKLDLEPDFEFASVSASLEAAVRGLDVLLLASEDSASEAVSAIEAGNESLEEKVPYEVFSLMTRRQGITRSKTKSTAAEGKERKSRGAR